MCLVASAEILPQDSLLFLPSVPREESDVSRCSSQAKEQHLKVTANSSVQQKWWTRQANVLQSWEVLTLEGSGLRVMS